METSGNPTSLLDFVREIDMMRALLEIAEDKPAWFIDCVNTLLEIFQRSGLCSSVSVVAFKEDFPDGWLWGNDYAWGVHISRGYAEDGDSRYIGLFDDGFKEASYSKTDPVLPWEEAPARIAVALIKYAFEPQSPETGA
jgi:hypothetical protein